MKIVIQNKFLKQMQSIRKLYLIVIKIYHFYRKEKKEKKQKNLFPVQKTKKNIVHIRVLKQLLNYGLKIKEVYRLIQFKQEAWLKSYIDMNTKLRKNAKMQNAKI